MNGQGFDAQPGNEDCTLGQGSLHICVPLYLGIL